MSYEELIRRQQQLLAETLKANEAILNGGKR